MERPCASLQMFFDVFKDVKCLTQNSLQMEKILALLRSKKFWTLVAAVVAALTAFFTTACSATARVQRHGVHIDTIRTDYTIRSRNIQTACEQNSKQILPIGRSMRSSGTFTNTASLSASGLTSSLGASTSLALTNFTTSSTVSTTIASPTSIDAKIRCLTTLIPFSSRSVKMSFGSVCLASSIFIAFPLRNSRSRRGGRRGKPKPKIKTIPLGGSHL